MAQTKPYSGADDMNTGFIYVVEMDGQGIYKIGKSVDVQRRLTQFGVQPPFPYRLLFAHRVHFHDRVERFLHTILQKQRLNGEWFRLTNNQLEIVQAELLITQGWYLLDGLLMQVRDKSIELNLDTDKLTKIGSVLARAIHRYARRMRHAEQLRLRDPDLQPESRSPVYPVSADANSGAIN